MMQLQIKNMTGISAPYEASINPDIEVITDGQSAQESVDHILKFLNQKINLKNG